MTSFPCISVFPTIFVCTVHPSWEHQPIAQISSVVWWSQVHGSQLSWLIRGNGVAVFFTFRLKVKEVIDKTIEGLTQ